MKIVVLDGYTLNPGDHSWQEVESFGDVTVHDFTEESDIVSRSSGAEIILTNKTPLTAATLEQLPDLKYIGVLATGFNVVDVEAARARGIPVTNIPTYGTDSVAQFVMALLLELCHHVAHHSEAVKGGAWERAGQFCFWDFPLIELAGRSMGIIGFGRIGRRVGEIADAFGMKVLAADVYRENPPAYPFEWAEIPEVFEKADVVSLHCPQTADNVEMVNRNLLERMKPTAFLINTSRGGLIQEADLAAALEAGTLAGAACDVVSSEPIRRDNPLLDAPNMILTPHIAWATLSARQRLMKTAAENIGAFLKGSPVNVVN